MSNEQTETRIVRVMNRAGMHLRPAAEFVKMAGRFQSRILVSKDGVEVDGKSIMAVLTIPAAYGVEIRVTAIGEDAAEAIHALAELVEGGFGEG